MSKFGDCTASPLGCASHKVSAAQSDREHYVRKLPASSPGRRRVERRRRLSAAIAQLFSVWLLLRNVFDFLIFVRAVGKCVEAGSGSVGATYNVDHNIVYFSEYTCTQKIGYVTHLYRGSGAYPHHHCGSRITDPASHTRFRRLTTTSSWATTTISSEGR